MELLYHLSYFGLLLILACKELSQGIVFLQYFQSHAVFILMYVQFTQRMSETETTPWQWLREAWASHRFELLLPVGGAVALAQFLTATFALRSGHRFLLLIIMAATVFALLRMAALLVRLSQEHAEGAQTTLSKRDLVELFLPQIAAVLLYALIAPTLRYGLFFAAISLPHLALLAYLARRYAAEALPAITLRLPTFETIGAPALRFARAVKTVVVSAWSVEKVPQIG